VTPPHGDRIALTVDVEEWFHAPETDVGRDEGAWQALAGLLPQALSKALDLLDGLDLKATFFVLGWAASRYPAETREIARRGHEVACHGWGHRPLDGMSPQEMLDDVSRAKRILEEVISQPVTGFRAPRWSMARLTWPYEILRQTGFLYSSSRLAIPGLGGGRARAEVISGVAELPALRFPWRWMPVPAGGTVAFRVLPTPWLMAARDRTLRSGEPAVFWFHPWELLPDSPRLPGSRWFRWARYRSLDALPERLEALVPPGDRTLGSMVSALLPKLGGGASEGRDARCEKGLAGVERRTT
jgi:polysaccharide deacetylase family protein (PEP-CTERM system associated)